MNERRFQKARIEYFDIFSISMMLIRIKKFTCQAYAGWDGDLKANFEIYFSFVMYMN